MLEADQEAILKTDEIEEDDGAEDGAAAEGEAEGVEEKTYSDGCPRIKSGGASSPAAVLRRVAMMEAVRALSSAFQSAFVPRRSLFTPSVTGCSGAHQAIAEQADLAGGGDEG